MTHLKAETALGTLELKADGLFITPREPQVQEALPTPAAVDPLLSIVKRRLPERCWRSSRS